MWMGLDLLVSKDEKESLPSIMWFVKAAESINHDLFHAVVPDLADLSSEIFLED